MDRNFDVRLIDFGATSFLHQRGTQETFIGTMHYASPEILLGTSIAHPPDTCSRIAPPVALIFAPSAGHILAHRRRV